MIYINSVKMMKSYILFITTMFFCTLSYGQESWNLPPVGSSLMVHGGTGLIQTPTSRMLPEGELILSYTDNDQYRFGSVTLQLFPWLQSTIRYTDTRTRLFSQVAEFSGDQTLKDKGIDAKFRLLKESYYLPELSVGFRDFGGTGFFESEFIGLSKRYGNVDFHLNIGWGYLGTTGNISNPFCEVKDSFCERPGGFSGRGGKIDHQRFFKGPASLFGGVEYQTPWQPLRLKLEYEGNNYIDDRAGPLKQDSRWNVGAAYRWHNFDFSVNYQRGNTVGFGINYNFNLQNINKTQASEPPRTLLVQSNDHSIEQTKRTRLIKDLSVEGGFKVNSANLNDDSVKIYGQQKSYRDLDEATERVGRILVSELPDTVKTYHIIETKDAIPLVETIIDADAFKNQIKNQYVASDLTKTYQRYNPSQETISEFDPENITGFFTRVDTFWTHSFGGPEAFYLYQAGLALTGGYKFKKNITASGTIKVNVFENFDKFKFTTDTASSSLPRVRTNIREYVSNRPVTVKNLFLQWNDRIAPNLFAQAYGGYLETMYGGIGGEILYRPLDSNFAFGVDLNYVKQRSYENDYEFFDYKVLTGHANIYWKPSFLPDMQLTLNIGQYLAKDKGVTVNIAKRFNSGVVVGAYSAFTNVSAEEYGEGSFTKGFYLSIPFDLFSLTPTKGKRLIAWSPIARDGGRGLDRPVSLYGITNERSAFAR